MLNLIRSDEKHPCVSLEEARDQARGELSFWRETFVRCTTDESYWNDFINELWVSDGTDEAVRLYTLFREAKSRRWLPMALVLQNCRDGDLWRAIACAQTGDAGSFIVWLQKHRDLPNDREPSAYKDDAALWQGISKAWAGDMKPLSDWIQSTRSTRSAQDLKGFDAEIAYWQALAAKQVAKVEAERKQEPQPGEEMTITLPGGVPMTFCWCPATTSEAWKKTKGGDDFFWMGSPESEASRNDNETRHRVRLTQGFWMGKYPVTQRQWEGVTGQNPSKFKGGDRPVENVLWDDCQKKFVEKINATGQVRVSLPTEAQWEHACRAGTMTPYSFGSALNGDRANCDGNYPYGTTAKGRYRQATSPVGEYAPNAWGLCDMHGNVREWCQDWYGSYAGDVTDPTGPASGADRVNRGGSWFCNAQYCRSANRDRSEPGYSLHYLGLRLVCSAGPRR